MVRPGDPPGPSYIPLVQVGGDIDYSKAVSAPVNIPDQSPWILWVR